MKPKVIVERIKLSAVRTAPVVMRRPAGREAGSFVRLARTA